MNAIFRFYDRSRYLRILQIAYPLLLVNASVVVMQLTDRKFLSRLSSEHLAAALPSGSLCFTLGCLLLGTTAFATPLIAQSFGRGDKKACAEIAWTALGFALLSGIFTALVMTPIGVWIIHMFGEKDSMLLKYELEYFVPLMNCFVFSYLNVALCAFFSGRGVTWVPSVVQVAMCILNIGFNYVLIFGYGPIPAFGMAGAAYGTIMSQASGVLIIFTWFLCVNQTEYPTRKIQWPKWIYLKEILYRGIPSGMHIFTDVAAFTFFIFFVGKLGLVAITSCTIAFSMNQLAFMPLLGLNEAAAILSGQYYGRNLFRMTKEIGYQTLQIGWIYCIIIALFYFFFGVQAIDFFRPDDSLAVGTAVDFEEVRRVTYHVLFFIGIYCFSDALIYACSGTMRGAGYTHKPMYLVACGHWLIWVPMTFLVMRYTSNLYYVWISMTVYLILLALAMLWLYSRGKWLTPHLYEKEKPVFPVDRPA